MRQRAHHLVLTGTDAEWLADANRLGELIYSELVAVPPVVSAPPAHPDRELLDHVEASRMAEDFYRVIGGERREGAIVVSQFDEPVDLFADARMCKWVVDEECDASLVIALWKLTPA